MTTYKITTLQVWDTTYSADSVEWCPIAPYHHVFVCGTYQLVQNATETHNPKDVCVGHETSSKHSQVKLGRLSLHIIDPSHGLHNLQTVELDAILDTKWCRKRMDDKVLLAVATAKGEILVFELLEGTTTSEKNEFSYILKLLTKVKLLSEEEEFLALSLDWCVSNCGTASALICVSDSHGGVSLLKFLDSVLILEDRWKVHEYEAWIAAFDYWNSSLIYSGGDDNKFLILDSRVGTHNPVLVNKIHESGVTSIHCNEAKENLLISGSYDEKIRFWDTRSIRRPLSSTPLIGGIWRLKWDPHCFDHILAACMYGGFCIVNAEDPVNPNIVAIYEDPSDLAYGCDWSSCSDLSARRFAANIGLQDLAESSVLSLTATCSFYDHTMSVSLAEKIHHGL